MIGDQVRVYGPTRTRINEMKGNPKGHRENQKVLCRLTEGWGTRAAVSLYLDRCQVDTPDEIVSKVWQLVRERRPDPVPKAVDFGAGDGRFARSGHYLQYCGYEVDPRRTPKSGLPRQAALFHQCAFSPVIDDADLCIGNPPFVRNQDLPNGWRERVAESLFSRTAINLSGLANAWQYFFLLALASTKVDGLVALVIPYEWVSRPSVQYLREFIMRHHWNVHVYRLRDETFDRVLTTSSITIIDKRQPQGGWSYFEEKPHGGFRPLPSVTETADGAIHYLKRSKLSKPKIFAKRGLSPGTQRVLVLTEGERVRSGLRVNSDVVPCVTSLRHLDADCAAITDRVFAECYRRAGLKCWLIRTDRPASARLREYLSAVPADRYQTATCLHRDHWWHFRMPTVPPILAATGFREERPKVTINCVGARAVGSVAGIYGVPARKRMNLIHAFRSLSLADRIVPHSNGLKKVEIHQINALLDELCKKTDVS
jgi:Eco57I restriction-modification methylase